MINRILWMVAALMMGGLHLHAQEVSVEYTSELQTNFSHGNFVNLVRLQAEMPLKGLVSMEVASISVAKTRKERLANDLQTFSNIEEDNLPLALAVCGLNWKMNEKHSLFWGIRNMNEDYFTSPVTSFFTNSSCGISPTISCNYPIANYPLASMGIHYRFTSKNLEVQASVFNGIGYRDFTGRENVFRFCPQSDGLFGLTQVGYQSKGNAYYLGVCGHYGKETEYKLGSTIWTYTEQNITENLSLIGAYSHAFASEWTCSDFVGGGCKLAMHQWDFGLFTDYARFAVGGECATEMTCKAQLSPHIYLQPTVHVIVTPQEDTAAGNSLHAIGMLRLGLLF